MKVIDRFIHPDFIFAVLKENKELIYDNVWRSNIGWQDEIVSPSGIVLIRSLSEVQKNILRKSLESNGIIIPNAKIELEAQAYLWHRLSYIPWHNDKEEDDGVRYAATLYLNEEWKDDWGGLFLYKNNNSIYAESPGFNKLVFNDNNFEHATSMLATDAPFRQTVQLFWKIIE